MVTWEKIEHNKVKMEIELTEEEVEEAIEKAYREMVKKVNLPGFRKGKVPRKIMEARFGPEIFYEDAVQHMVPEAYSSAVDEAEIEPIDEPDIDVVQIEKGKPFIFTATVEVKPEVTLGDYKGIKVEVEKDAIDEDTVSEYLSNLRERHARLVPVEEEDAVVQEGDQVLIDFQGFIDGEPFEGGQSEDHSLTIGSGSFIEGFEDQLIGASQGEEKEIKVTFPEEYGNEELNGKEATFHVKIKEIKRKELPELNDDFAKEVSDFDTLEEFREDINKKLEEEIENTYKYNMEEAIIQKVSENAEVEIPEVMVERQIEQMIGEIEQRIKMQGLSLEQFLQLSGKTREDLAEQYREDAEKRVKSNLVLSAIMKEEGIEVTDQEIDDKIQELAETHNDSSERIKEIFKQQGRLNMMREEIRIRKVVDFLVEQAEVETVVKDPQETKEEEKEEAEETETSAQVSEDTPKTDGTE